jgi:hypothetical protein
LKSKEPAVVDVAVATNVSNNSLDDLKKVTNIIGSKKNWFYFTWENIGQQ